MFYSPSLKIEQPLPCVCGVVLVGDLPQIKLRIFPTQTKKLSSHGDKSTCRVALKYILGCGWKSEAFSPFSFPTSVF
jgi:hypothetical protein